MSASSDSSSRTQRTTSESPPEDHSNDDWWNYCPNCGHRLESRSCKYRCPNCHYFMSCSDFD